MFTPPLFFHFLVVLPLPLLSLRRNFLGELLRAKCRMGYNLLMGMGRKRWGCGDEIYIWMAKSKSSAEKIVSIVGIFVGKDFKNGGEIEISGAKRERGFQKGAEVKWEK